MGWNVSAWDRWNRVLSRKSLQRVWQSFLSSVLISTCLYKVVVTVFYRRMNRHYTTEDYLRRCEILRKHFKRPAITTDVIVGFPGETKEEFDITEKYLEKVHFYEMHVFKYSRRAGTKAAAMTDQIPEQDKGSPF